MPGRIDVCTCVPGYIQKLPSRAVAFEESISGQAFEEFGTHLFRTLFVVFVLDGGGQWFFDVC